jgi:LAO/AO transport system kinase
MKAGLIELPDVFCVNKADLGAAARRTHSELSSALSLPERAPGGWLPPVLLVSARDGSGIDALLEATDAHRAQALASGALLERRREGAVQHVLSALAQRFGSYGLEKIGGGAAVRRRMTAEPKQTSFRWAEMLASEVLDALRKPE